MVLECDVPQVHTGVTVRCPHTFSHTVHVQANVRIVTPGDLTVKAESVVIDTAW